MKHLIATVIASTLLICPAMAQTKNSPIYRAAASQWSSLDAYQRVRLQVYLTAAGYWPAVPNQDFGMRLFEAISQFQSDHGQPRTGILNDEQIDLLIKAAEPILREWGMREITHPTRRVSIWAPLGLGLVQKRVRDGLEYTDPQGRVFLGFKFLENVGLREVRDYLLQQALADGAVVQYEVLRKNFFVVSVFKDGLTRYMRYHQDGRGLLGFVFGWNDAGAQIYGERIVTLISSSLWAVANGAPFVTPPKIVQEAAHPPAQRIEPPAQAPKKEKDEDSLKSGTGFFVSQSGFILTNNHVIKGCSNVAVGSDDYQPTPARVVGTDPTNDLALLQANIIASTVAILRPNARLGEAVAVFGYPLSEVLATSGNFTQGSITALAGLRDDTRHLQIQAPVQSGNSGGPLLDASGNVIGVVVAMMDAKRMLEVTDTLPQNINFAIKTSVATNFLESKGVQFETVSSNSNPMKPEDIAERAKKLSVMVACK